MMTRSSGRRRLCRSWVSIVGLRRLRRLGLSRPRRMLTARLLVLRIRLCRRSRLTGLLRKRLLVLLQVLRRRRRVARLLLLVRRLMLLLVPCLRRRPLGRLPVRLGTLQGPRPRRQVAPQMLQRRPLLPLIVPLVRILLVLPLWWRVQGRRLPGLARRLHVMRQTAMLPAPSWRQTSSV